MKQFFENLIELKLDKKRIMKEIVVGHVEKKRKCKLSKFFQLLESTVIQQENSEDEHIKIVN